MGWNGLRRDEGCPGQNCKGTHEDRGNFGHSGKRRRGYNCIIYSRSCRSKKVVLWRRLRISNQPIWVWNHCRTWRAASAHRTFEARPSCRTKWVAEPAATNGHGLLGDFRPRNPVPCSGLGGRWYNIHDSSSSPCMYSEILKMQVRFTRMDAQIQEFQTPRMPRQEPKDERCILDLQAAQPMTSNGR